MHVGLKYGRLTIASEPADGRVEVVCECGTKKGANIYKLKSGHTRSCGCLRREMTHRKRLSHGSTGSPAHRSWAAMKRRCLNRADIGFPLYGGRGISVCDRWLDFANFLADMGQPDKGQSLDRIDSGGNYSPDNCRWVDALTQQNNRRDNIRLRFQGLEMTISQWARQIGIKPATLMHRHRKGWSTEETLTTPVRRW